MTANTFDTEESNSNINSPQYFVDDDGSLKFISPVLSSSNFDGSVPVFEGQIPASEISPGKFIKTGEEYFPVISVAYDDQELEDSPSDEIAVTYLDSNSEVQEIIYNLTDDVDVKYENWEEKYLGTQGWSLTYGGNAIFANVGVRGDLEATTLDVGGETGITYDGETVIIGASVVINAPVTFNSSGSFVTYDFLSASYADLTELSTSGTTVINGGNITTGTINAGLVRIENSTTANRGVKITSSGLEGFDTSGNRTFYLNTNGSLDINGYATDGELSGGLSGKIDDGAAAADIVTFNTTITGGNISTGRIKSSGYNGPTSGGGSFSTVGSQFNLDDGSIVTPNFRITNGGSAFFKGDITANSGYFGNPAYGISIVDNGSSVELSTTTLRILSKVNSGTLHGVIDFYSNNGTSIGELSSAGSSKTWTGLGDGIILGTASDYIFLPSSTNTTRSRYLGSGFNWYDSGSNLLMSISGGAGRLQIYRDVIVNSPYELETNGIKNSGNGITNNGGQINSLPTASNPISATANINIDSGTGLIKRISSTQKIKFNITPINENNLSNTVTTEKINNSLSTIDYKKVLDICPVEYSTESYARELWPENQRILGFIAEDIADKLPEVATYDENGDPEYYQINSIVAALLAVVQDQQNTINELKEKVSIIEERVQS